MTRLEALKEREIEARENARRAGKQGAGTHRNAGDSGRVAALWLETRAELHALIAQEESA